MSSCPRGIAITMPATGQRDFPEEGVLVAYNDATASSCSSDEETLIAETMHKEQPQVYVKAKLLATFESLPSKGYHEEFIRSCVDLLLRHAVFEGTDRSGKVLDFKMPEQLRLLIDFNLESRPSTHDELKTILRDIVKYSVKTGHPYFANQLFSSVDPYGLVGQWMTDALNPSVYTYEVAPVFTLMEEVVLEEMRRFVGYKNGKGDGIFCPGGSLANGCAINCARYRYMPEIKTKGLHSLPRLVLFTSEDSHYSIKKMASLLGIGSDNVYCIKTDSRGKMSTQHLREEVKRSKLEGGVPFMVSATAGTTVLGAFDPLEEIADVCEENQMWMHVDAAWGGGALISKKYRHLLKGIERSDSVTWNPHKLLCSAQQCSTLLLKHEGILEAAHSTNAAYLFQKDKFYDTKYDIGDKHIQCGRRADVLKFWFMWKAKGTDGLEKHIVKIFENSRHFLNTIRNRPGFELVLDNPECTNVCFWYVPPSIRDSKDDPGYEDKLNSIAPKIKERMMKEGTMMVTYQAIKGHPNFFRIVFQNSGLDGSDVAHLVREFERLGADL